MRNRFATFLFLVSLAVCVAEKDVGEWKQQLVGCHKDLAALIHETNSNPIMIRLAWHDSGNFDKDSSAGFPKAGGATGSIRFGPEIDYGANAGLKKALELLEPIKQKFPLVSYADIFQMASAIAVEMAGGPNIPMKYGRVDATGPEDCPQDGNLPDAEAGPEGFYGSDAGTQSTKDATPAGHLRKVFHRMGLNDQEIVALSGAHTLGRVHKDRSGLGAEKTKFTNGEHIARGDGKKGHGSIGGSPWTKQWLKFDNSYFATIPDDKTDPELAKLSTDKILFVDEGFKPFAEKYRASQEAFFADYAAAHAKLSELGARFDPPGGIELHPETCAANRKAAAA